MQRRRKEGFLLWSPPTSLRPFSRRGSVSRAISVIAHDNKNKKRRLHTERRSSGSQAGRYIAPALTSTSSRLRAARPPSRYCLLPTASIVALYAGDGIWWEVRRTKRRWRGCRRHHALLGRCCCRRMPTYPPLTCRQKYGCSARHRSCGEANTRLGVSLLSP